jgi:hypothetical protein
MANTRRLPSPKGNVRRLLLEGSWQSDFDKELEAGDFDRLELHGSGQVDLVPLAKYADRVTSLWINCPLQSARGMSSLSRLRDLVVSFEVRGADFGSLPEIEDLQLDFWRNEYEAQLPTCAALANLRISGYSGRSLRYFSGFGVLRSLALVAPRIEGLDGLESCQLLSAIKLVKAAQLTDSAAIGSAPVLHSLWIEGAKKIGSIESLARRRGMVDIYLTDTAGLQSTSFLRSSPELKSLWLNTPTVAIDFPAVLAARRIRNFGIRSAGPLPVTEAQFIELAESIGRTVTSVAVVGPRTMPMLQAELVPVS